MFRTIMMVVLMLVGEVSWAAAHNITGQTVIRLATGWGGEGFYVNTQGVLPAGADCGDGNSFVMEPGQAMQKEMISMLLMAKQNRTPVDLYVDGCKGSSMKLKAVAF